jgi:hypothetical protein
MVCIHEMEKIEMKRIVVLLACGMMLLVANSAEARIFRRNNRTSQTQTVRTVPATYTVAPTPARPVNPVPAAQAQPAAAVQPQAPATQAQAQPQRVVATTVSYSTATAQGVANIMASRNQVGHFGGNPGYEGCGCGATPQAAYAICCYGNSGMATVDVGYARSASGMWFCCRRYR